MPDLPYFLSKAQEAHSACFEEAPNFRTKAAEPPPMQPPSESQISEQGPGRWRGLASRRPAGVTVTGLPRNIPVTRSASHQQLREAGFCSESLVFLPLRGSDQSPGSGVLGRCGRGTWRNRRSSQPAPPNWRLSPGNGPSPRGPGRFFKVASVGGCSQFMMTLP